MLPDTLAQQQACKCLAQASAVLTLASGASTEIAAQEAGKVAARAGSNAGMSLEEARQGLVCPSHPPWFIPLGFLGSAGFHLAH